jgi:hypothetical protein
VFTPAQAVDGPESVAVGGVLTVTLAEPPAGHPLFVTVTPSPTGPVGPALNVTERVPVPPVIVPFEMVQAYVAPAPASGTEATSPVAFGHVEAGAVIVAFGEGFTVTAAEPEELPVHPVASTTLVTVYVLVAPGLTLRVAGLDEIPVSWNPSLQFSVHAAVPVRTMESGVDWPAQIVALPETAAVGRAAIGMLFDELAGQPAFETVTDRSTVPLAPALNVIVRVPAPFVIVPFVIDQLYVAPDPASGPEAVSPVAALHADDGAVMTAEGVATTVTVALPVAVPAQFASVTTVTEYVVVAEGDTVRVAGLEEIPL